MSQKLEYDAAVGGNVVLETHVQTFRYASAAAKEIRSLLAASKNDSGTKLIFQTLPKHMRRRAMSHYPKRLPRKYRGVHIAQMAKSGKQRIIRRPSRKYRRRPSNLLQDYQRRQRRNVWLETHIWHAKRFHMIERWGYKLPLTSCDKTYRACYRATSDHCLVQDISFNVCLELHGKVSCLFNGLKELSNNALTTNSCLSIKAITYLNGQREGSIDLFRRGRFPEGALCRATFMWRPAPNANSLTDDNMERRLWLWVHPCVYSTLLEELINVFEVQLIKDDNKEKCESDNDSVSKKQKLRFQFMTNNLSHTRIRRYVNTDTGTKLADLKDTLNRYRLTGPLSHSVLTHAFKTKDPCAEENSTSNWFHELLQDEQFKKQHKDQTKFWQQCENLKTPAALRPNMILALNIVDTRLQRPAKRTKAVPNRYENFPDFFELLTNVPKTLAQSSIWDENIREQLRSKMLSTHNWCQLRQKHALVPGAPCAFENTLQPIPVLLIQRPGLQQSHKRLNYGCGWDVIVPAGYGMAIWQTFIMWGAKPGGLRELNTVAREMGSEVFLPDTIGGRQQAIDKYKVSYEKYFRLPPGKRHNYRKLAIVSPFRAPWTKLLRDWMPMPLQRNVNENENENLTFFVERDKSKLMLLSAQKNPSIEVNSNGVIQLQLRMKARGNIESNALICLPTYADIKKYHKNCLQQSHWPVHTEPLQPDLNEKERKVARSLHKTQLKRLRAKRIREKRKLQETSTKRVRIRSANTESLIAAQFDRMCKLWLPNEDCSTYLSVRKQCSRETIGYVTEACFSYTQGTVCAIGYVTLQGLQSVFNLFQSQKSGKQPMCLLRDINSSNYYFATFEISESP